jgi:hypothetical protein
MNSGEQCVVVVLKVNVGKPLILQIGEWMGSDEQWGAVRGSGGAGGQCR